MNKLIVSVILIAVTGTVFGQVRRGQTYESELKNVIKINPLSLVLTNISVSYERIITGRIGIQLQAGYWIGGNIGNTKWSGMSLTPELRYYLTNQERPKGLYLAAFGRYQEIQAEIQDSNSEWAVSRIGGGVSVGYQMLFGGRVTWDIFFGPQYLVNSGSKDEISTADYGQFIGSFGLRLGTTLGVAF